MRYKKATIQRGTGLVSRPNTHHSKTVYYIDFSLPVDGDNLVSLLFSDEEREARQAFLEQVKNAFAVKPSLAGVIHGRRRIHLGKRGSSRSGFFPSKKNATGSLGTVSLPMDSRTEARYAMELERSRNVQAFRPQAVVLDLPGNGRCAYPDFLVLDVAGHLSLHEVKADKKYLSAQDQQDFDHLAEKLERWGVGFTVVDANDMPSDAKYQNLQWLHQRVLIVPDEGQISELLNLEFSRCTYGELKALCRASEMDESVVPYGLLTERLNVDWNITLDDESEVWK